MLQGGSEASNTDPDASESAEDEAWMSSTPHLMVLLPGGLVQARLISDFADAGP